MFINKLIYQFCLGGFALWCIATPTLSLSQITSDGTLSTEVTSLDKLNFTINGGNKAEGNLFHSFNEFSVPIGGTVLFNNALDVQNIITRVTGGSISNIDGLIRANGSANIFLLNPNGIIFGSNAQLDIKGSFLASTANRLNFADGRFFSTTNPQAQPLLTINVPIGLQFGETVGTIVNQFVPKNIGDVPVGLQLQPGKTLALVGGDVFIEGGGLFAPRGRIELGSVADSSLVSLTPIATGWVLGYEDVQSFRDIQLSQSAFIDTGGKKLGNIQLRGKNITITNSQVGGLNFGADPGGTLTIKASESVEISENSNLSTGTLSTGAAGDITIETRQLIVLGGSFIDAMSEGDGRGGNITLNASESVEVNGKNQLFTKINTEAFADGNAGNVKIKTGRLILRDGGQISSSTSGAGNGGSVIVDASQLVEVSSQGEIFEGEVIGSGLFTQTREPFATGNGGRLEINTKRLVVKGAARVSVAAIEGSTGQAGSLGINASDSVEVSGIGSTLRARSESSKPAGNLTITTDKLIVRDEAEVSVSSSGSGDAGVLTVNADSINLDTQGKLIGTTASGKGADIRLDVRDFILMRNNSAIATTAANNGSGGNITINSPFIIAVPTEDSNILANAQRGSGGRITIKATGIFGLENRSNLTPSPKISEINASSEFGVNGTVEINTPDTDPAQGLTELPTDIVDVSRLIGQDFCRVVGQNSEFVVTGRGGLPTSPNETLRANAPWEDLRLVQESEPESPQLPPASRSEQPKMKDNQPQTIVEAQGWITSSNGNVLLTAKPVAVTPQGLWLHPLDCQWWKQTSRG
ncbi:S-layer family protein [Nostocales cyanobacterium LEGE 12452]|nr:S-layer family protein [Nostocales cyanobacterium LEGE 12452]